MSTPLVELVKRLPDRLGRFAPYFIAAELCYGVDPYYLAAICDQESRGGDALVPRGPAGRGDGGHGRGLMQIDDRYHDSFVSTTGDDGKALWTEPAFNILYAARLLRLNLELGGNDYFVAVAAYNCGLSRAKAAVRALGPDATIPQQRDALDKLTTNKSYLSRVLALRDGFLSTCMPS